MRTAAVATVDLSRTDARCAMSYLHITRMVVALRANRPDGKMGMEAAASVSLPKPNCVFPSNDEPR